MKRFYVSFLALGLFADGCLLCRRRGGERSTKRTHGLVKPKVQMG